jgi:hypothetical protein
VTEINAATGAFVRELAGKKYGFRDPTGIAAAGRTVWVTNMGGNSVTQLRLS